MIIELDRYSERIDLILAIELAIKEYSDCPFMGDTIELLKRILKKLEV